MTKVSREEVLRVAQMSKIAVREQEIVPLMQRMEQVLSYAERVKQVAIEIQEPSAKNINVFRDDVAIPQNSEKLLAQAPERAGDYFVVPMILDN